PPDGASPPAPAASTAGPSTSCASTSTPSTPRARAAAPSGSRSRPPARGPSRRRSSCTPGTGCSVPAPDVQHLLRDLITGLGAPVVVHCCAADAPVRLLAAAGVAGIGIDATLPAVSGDTAVPAALDALGEIWDAGTPLLLGLVP